MNYTTYTKAQKLLLVPIKILEAAYLPLLFRRKKEKKTTSINKLSHGPKTPLMALSLIHI